MKAVHFGAGNIGRGLIAPTLTQSGFDVCFVARNQKQVSQLQQRGKYRVTLANDDRDSFMVHNVTANSISHTQEVAQAIAEADIITTAVGMSALKDIAESIAKGLEFRLKHRRDAVPVQIIACENGLKASDQLKQYILRHLRPASAEQLKSLMAYPNTLIDRIVPVQKQADPLQIMVEPFSEWVIHDIDAIQGLPRIEGVRYVKTLDPYLERKLFTVNTGHCCAAYFAYLEGCTTIQEAMGNPSIRERVRAVLQETGALLVSKHHFDPEIHERYILKILRRFSNANFTDKIERIGRSPLRKLSPHERLLRPALDAHALGLPTGAIVSAIASALMFDTAEDPEAVRIQEHIRAQGIKSTVTELLGLSSSHPLHPDICKEYQRLCMKYPHMARTGFEAMISAWLPPAVSGK